MKKAIISMIMVLTVLFSVGCEYVPADKSKDTGVTYINLSEILTSDEKTENAAKKEAEPAVEEKAEVSVKEMPTVKVVEGDLVSFPNLKATDPDGDKITYTFSAPLNVKGEWQTKEGDAGEKTVTITASDGLNEISQDVKIVIEQLNKAPVMEKIADIKVNEGETVKFSPKVVDPEGKTVTIAYSGWMNSDTKKLDYNSAGSYIVRVTASDGVKESFQDVKVTVEDVNRAPTFLRIV
jgi:nitrogen fixation protein FixH